MSSRHRLSLHVGDYLKDTPPISCVNWEHHGIYMIALMIAWTSPGCSLPNDEQWLAKRFGCTPDEYRERVAPVIRAYFKVRRNRLYQKRLTKERLFAEKQSKKQSGAAKSRWEKEKSASHGIATALPETPRGNAPLSPSLSLSPKKESPGVDDGLFTRFWDAYPSRGAHGNPKKPAKAKFDAAVKRGVDPETIIRGAAAYAQQVARAGTQPQYVAQAVTWLNQERWGDATPPLFAASGQGERAQPAWYYGLDPDTIARRESILCDCRDPAQMESWERRWSDEADQRKARAT